MSPDDLLALCIVMEAGGETDDGKAAVARVIRNRMKLKFFSDGTIVGTILRYDQFSWAWFNYVSGKYVRVAGNIEQAQSLAFQKYNMAPRTAIVHAAVIGTKVFADIYRGNDYDKLTDAAVLYVNPAMVTVPIWADPSKIVCTIGHHTFYSS